MPLISFFVFFFSWLRRTFQQSCRIFIFIPCVIVLFAVVALATFSERWRQLCVCSCTRVTIAATGAMETQQLQEQARFHSFSLLCTSVPLHAVYFFFLSS